MANMARMSPTYATDLALGGATPIAMVQNAVMAIEAGMANTVMCVHARKRATPDPTPGNPIRHGDEHWEEPWGHFSAVANHAFAAQRRMHDFGTTSEDLAHVAVATRKHACLNGNATMRKAMTIADHQASRYIAYNGVPAANMSHGFLRTDDSQGIVRHCSLIPALHHSILQPARISNRFT